MSDEQRRNNDMQIGKLIAQSESSSNQIKTLFGKVDNLAGEMSAFVRAIEKNTERTEARLEAQDKILAAHSSSISVLNKFRTRAYLGLAGVTGTSGFGAYYSGLLKKFGLG